MADPSFQERLDRLEAEQRSGKRTAAPAGVPSANAREGNVGWFRWMAFVPSVFWGSFAHMSVLFANMHYEQAKADYEAVPQIFYIILGCAAFGLLSYLILVLLVRRALTGQPQLFSVVLGFFIGVAVISLM